MKRYKHFHLIIDGILSLIIIAVAVVCFYPTVSRVSTTEESLFSHGDAESNKVSLMFNVYWGTDVVYDILGTLDKYGVKCTFFIGGCWADDNIEALRQIVLSGHEIGNHGYFHKDHGSLSLEGNVEEIRLCHDFVKKATNIDMTLFAPPSGAYNKDTLSAADQLGYQTILWSRDTIDWRDKDSSLIYSRATNVSGGDFVLMHPMQETADALEDILRYYQNNGLSAVTVSENLSSLKT